MVFAEYAMGCTPGISGFTVGITRIISENKDYTCTNMCSSGLTHISSLLSDQNNNFEDIIL